MASRRPQWAALAACALGFELLVRLPNMLDAAVVVAFVVLGAGRATSRFLAWFAPVYLAFAACDRWYQWVRFGSLCSTYSGVLGIQRRPAGAPAGFPFGYPFWHGFWGALVLPEKSVFLYDSLLVAVIALLVWRWRSLAPDVKRYAALLAAALLGYVSFYATYYTFAGDDAWGDRFAATTVDLIAMLAGPLAVRYWREMRAPARVALAAVALVSFVEQIVSTCLPVSVEPMQRTAGIPGVPIVRRIQNLILLARGDLANSAWASVPATRRNWDYLAFHLRENYPALMPVAFLCWSVLVALLACVVVLILKSMRAEPDPPVRRAA